MGPYLLVGILVLFMFGFVMMFVSDDARGPMSKVYAVVGCLLFSMFIVYDTQLIVGVNKWGDPHRCAIKHRCGRLHSSRSCFSAGTFLSCASSFW
jgi:FtsH-binding integral membrane protein